MKELAVQYPFVKTTFQRFASKFQDDYKWVENSKNFNIFMYYATFVSFSKCFGVRMLQRLTTIEHFIQ